MSSESCTFNLNSGEFDSRLDTAAVPADHAPAVLRLIRKLAEGQPVSRSDVGIEDAAVWDELKSLGVEVDDADRIVALGGLSVRPTRHRFVVGDRELYTWCALDNLFLPYLLDEPADVTSACPVTGEQIHLRISPTGIEEARPEGVVVSLVRAEANRSDGGRNELFGTRGSFCSRVHFFVSSDVASSWLADHPNAVIVPLEEAFRIGREECSLPLLEGAPCDY